MGSDDLIDAGVVVKALLELWRGDPWVFDRNLLRLGCARVDFDFFVRIEFWAVLMKKEIQGLAKVPAFSWSLLCKLEAVNSCSALMKLKGNKFLLSDAMNGAAFLEVVGVGLD